MKTKVLFIALGCILFAGIAQGQQRIRLRTTADSLAYYYGTSLARSVRRFKYLPEKFRVKAFEKAFKDAFDQKRPLPPPGEASTFLNDYFNVRLPAENLRASEAWLAEVERTTPGIQRTESGLLYRIIDPGSSVRVTHDEDRVTVRHEARLCDGRIVDPLCGLTTHCALICAIPGWTEGLKLVGEGGRIHLWLHPDLAYGVAEDVVMELGLAPNTPLWFEIEVIDVIPAKE